MLFRTNGIRARAQGEAACVVLVLEVKQTSEDTHGSDLADAVGGGPPAGVCVRTCTSRPWTGQWSVIVCSLPLITYSVHIP